MIVRKTILTVAVLLLALAPGVAQAQGGGQGQNAGQNSTITATITTVPALGNVVSAGSGDTSFTINSSTGLVTRSSGLGVRLTSATPRALATVNCSSQGNQCAQAAINGKIGPAGTPTLRARTLTNFTVTMGSAVLASTPTTGSPITFQINAVSSGSNATFYV